MGSEKLGAYPAQPWRLSAQFLVMGIAPLFLICVPPLMSEKVRSVTEVGVRMIGGPKWVDRNTDEKQRNNDSRNQQPPVLLGVNYSHMEIELLL